jgi:hypothetical protein
MSDNGHVVGNSYELPNPAGLRQAVANAMRVGSPAVAFPIADVLKLASDVERAMVMIAGMRAIIDTQAILARQVILSGREILELAGAGDVEGLDGRLPTFEALMKGLEDALPEADEASEPPN